MVLRRPLDRRSIKTLKKDLVCLLARESSIETSTAAMYRGTSLIRNTSPVGPYSSPLPRDLWGSLGAAAASYEQVSLYAPPPRLRLGRI